MTFAVIWQVGAVTIPSTPKSRDRKNLYGFNGLSKLHLVRVIKPSPWTFEARFCWTGSYLCRAASPFVLFPVPATVAVTPGQHKPLKVAALIQSDGPNSWNVQLTQLPCQQLPRLQGASTCCSTKGAERETWSTAKGPEGSTRGRITLPAGVQRAALGVPIARNAGHGMCVRAHVLAHTRTQNGGATGEAPPVGAVQLHSCIVALGWCCEGGGQTGLRGVVLVSQAD